MRKYKKGFTLVELIVVIVIIAILSVVMIPTLTKYIDRANYSKDLQQTEALNTFIENNSLLFYDMEINSRDDVIELLKADDPNRELNLTVKSDGYYLWFDIENRKIILETYENMDKKSQMANLSTRSSDRSCLSEFFKGYYFLDEGKSSLSKVIEIIENLKDVEKNKNQSYAEVAKALTEALLKVKKDGFEKAYEEYIKYLNSFPVKDSNNNIFDIYISENELKPNITINATNCKHEKTEVVLGKAATCTESGLKDGKKCALCDVIIIAQEVIQPLGHKAEVIAEYIAPTCTELGLTEKIHCSVCKVVLQEQTVIEATGHTETVMVAVAPTCTKTGLTEGKQCSVCNDVLVKQEIISATGHTEVIDLAVEPTCTDTGLTEGKHCSVCNDVLVVQEVVSATGHTEVIDVAVQSTCTDTGLTEGKHCSVCKVVLVAQTIVAAGHKYDDDNDMICNSCSYDRTQKVEVKFILPDGTQLHVEQIKLNTGISEDAINLINNYKDTVAGTSNHQALRELVGWYDEKDTTKKLITDFSKITEDKVFVASIKETVISYNINIYYDDKDNMIGDSTYILNESISNHPFGKDINIKKQIQHNKLYLFYMSPKAVFGQSDWLNLLNSINLDDPNSIISLCDNKNNLEFLARISMDKSTASGTLDLVVLCVQPAAIMSTNSQISWGSDTISVNNDWTFYLTVEEALLNSNNSTKEYIRIYGQGKNDINVNAYLPDTNPTITGHSLTINNITYTIPNYTLNMSSKYVLGYDGSREFTIESVDTLILPYYRNDATKDGYLLEQITPEGVEISQTIHSYLMINDNTTLNVNGTLIVGAKVVSNGSNSVGVISTKAVIMNNGNIICEDDSIVKSYGYIKGQRGTLELKSGATLIDVFRLYDYAGGQISKALNDIKIFPTQVYSFHNVSCDLKLNYGSTFKAYGQINASGSFVMNDDLIMFGDGGLFELTEEDGYIMKSVEDTTRNTSINTSFISSNQDVTQREVLNIYGSFTDNAIKLTLASAATISTSTSMPMPIGMMKIVFNKGVALLDSISYKFLPGSELIIGESAEFIFDSKVTAVFYDSSYNDNFTYLHEGNIANPHFRYSNFHSEWFSQSASRIGSKLVVNGYLNAKGYFSGKIDSASNGKVLVLNNNVTISEIKSVSYVGGISGALGGTKATSENKTYYAIGLVNGFEIATFSAGVTYYYTDSGYWTTVGNQSISFDSLGGSEFESIGFISSINSNNKITTNLSSSLNFNSTYIPSRTGYTFGGWYFDKAYKYPANVNDIMGSITLYAKWIANEYNITYNLSGGVMPNTYPTKHIFGKTTVLPIPTKVGYSFFGWYLTSDLNTNGASSVASLDGTSYTSQIVLYARWESDSKKQYYITLIDEVNGTENSKSLEDGTGTGAILGQICNTPTTSKNINFKGWFDAQGTQYTSTSTITSDITLYAKWQCTIKYNANGGTLKGNSEDTYDYGTVPSKPSDPTPPSKNTFSKWLDESSNEYTFDKALTSNITLKAEYASSGGSCFTSGTIITLADGTHKKIEDITIDDVLLVFDHENGVYTASPIIFIENDGMDYYNVITLKFDNGITSKIIYEHGFFDLTLNKYVYITEENYTDYIGHSFAVYDEELKTYNTTVLVESSLEEEYTGCYSLVTVYHMNYFIDGLFSFPGGIEGLFNYFEYDESLKYDEDKMEADILEYGLYTYDDFKDYIPYEVYEYVFPTKYFKVAVGKGMITYDEIVSLIEKYLVGHGII